MPIRIRTSALGGGLSDDEVVSFRRLPTKVARRDVLFAANDAFAELDNEAARRDLAAAQAENDRLNAERAARDAAAANAIAEQAAQAAGAQALIDGPGGVPPQGGGQFVDSANVQTIYPNSSAIPQANSGITDITNSNVVDPMQQFAPPMPKKKLSKGLLVGVGSAILLGLGAVFVARKRRA